MARSSLGPGLDGILVVAKPAGPTSHDVVALVRRLAATKRVGHGGTLDPFAAGVLPVFLGHGTRVVEYHLGDRKAYRATVCFGASSTTDDLEGELTPAAGPAPTRAAVEAALPGLTGAISQRPPAYSAVKVGGRRAYAMARAGETVELALREVTIHSLDIVSWDGHRPGPADRRARRHVLGGHVRAGACARPRGDARERGLSRRADPDGIGPVHDRRRHAARRDPGRRRGEPGGPDGVSCCRSTRVSTRSRSSPWTADELAAVAKGQFIRPTGGLPGPADHYRLVGPDGTLVAIASGAAGRLAPDKVFVAAPAAAPVA